MRARLRPLGPLLVAGILLFLGSIPGQSGLPLPQGLDKLAHAIGYGSLGAVLALCWWRRRPARMWTGLLVIIGISIGCLDELNQSRIPGRQSDPLDVAADAVGLLVAISWLRGWRAPDRDDTPTPPADQ